MIRIFAIVLAGIFTVDAEAQIFFETNPSTCNTRYLQTDDAKTFSKISPLDFTLGSIITVNTHASNVDKVYLLDEDGQTVSQGFAPSVYYRPNNNLLIVKGTNTNSDSFNPYGALNIGEALFLGAINRFISGFGGPGRKHFSEVVH